MLVADGQSQYGKWQIIQLKIEIPIEGDNHTYNFVIPSWEIEKKIHDQNILHSRHWRTLEGKKGHIYLYNNGSRANLIYIE